MSDSRVLNPFQPDFGNAPPLLAGRDELIRFIMSALAQGPRVKAFTSLMLGPRGVGKTAALNAISDEAAAAGWRVIAADALLSPPDGETVPEQIIELCHEHLEDITPPKAARTTGVQVPIVGGVQFERHTPRPRTFRRLLSDLERDALEQGAAGVLITVDELHNLEPPEASRLSSAFQRLVKKEHKQIGFIGVGLPSVEHLLLPNKGFTFFQRCHREPVRHVSIHDAEEAIRWPLAEHEVEIAPADLRRAASATLGYGYAIQSVGHHIWELAAAPTGRITPEIVTHAIQRMEDDIGTHVTTPIWSRLPDGQKRFLMAMAANGEPARLADIARRSNTGVVTYKNRLLEEGVLTETPDGQLMFSNAAVRSRALAEIDLQTAAHEEAMRREAERSAVEASGYVERQRARCNEWMPRAGKYCMLPAGHRGPHRSRR